MQPPFEMLAVSDIERFRRDTFWTKEPECLAWIDSFADGAVFYDVGANVGIYSLYCAAVRPRCRVFAFEPDAKNFAHLEQNIAMNRPNNITAHQYAISDKCGRTAFHEASSEIGATGGQIDSVDLCDGRACYQVQAATLDALSVTWDIPHHVKIDIDGQELRVVRGMQKLLGNPFLQSVLIEVDLEPTDSRREICERFAAAGFCTVNRFNMMANHSRVRRAAENVRVENIVWTRKGG
jgi:FkbM family methyltransferase